MDYTNKVIEPYGWDWGNKPFYNGSFYLRTRDNPSEIVGSNSITFSSTPLVWSSESDLDTISGTLRLTSGSDEYAEYVFESQRVDTVLYYKQKAGGYFIVTGFFIYNFIFYSG